jgi:hypothetical protein
LELGAGARRVARGHGRRGVPGGGCCVRVHVV